MTEDNDKLFTNNEYPTLHIKNFAKIKEANIELAPFTLFVGDNNSGKSYLLSLIWGLKTYVVSRLLIKKMTNEYEHTLHNSNSMPLRKNIESIMKSDLYKKCLNQCSKYLPKKIEEHNLDNLNRGNLIEEIKIGKEFIYDIFRLYNEMLNAYKDDIIDYVFDNKNIKIEHLSISTPKNLDIEVSLRHYMGSEFNEIPSSIELSVKKNGSSIAMDGGILTRLISEVYLLELIMSKCLDIVVWHSMRSIKDDLFFPASRTGFVLLNKNIQSRALDSLFTDGVLGRILGLGLGGSIAHNRLSETREDDNFNTLKLTKPVEEFYRWLALLDADNLEDNEISNFIEENIIHGSVKLNNMSTPEIRYRPDNFEDDFPMKVTSAVVTELVPLILFLKDNNRNQNIMFEEPEISLHPRLQQKITRVFIKLVNSGRQVFITTHSDTIVQHINNMIKLANNKPERQEAILKKSKFNYDKDDIIHQDKIRMYQFDIDEKTQRTTIRDLAASEYGFEIPTFNDFLDDISDEIDTLLEKMPDETDKLKTEP